MTYCWNYEIKCPFSSFFTTSFKSIYMTHCWSHSLLKTESMWIKLSSFYTHLFKMQNVYFHEFKTTFKLEGIYIERTVPSFLHHNVSIANFDKYMFTTTLQMLTWPWNQLFKDKQLERLLLNEKLFTFK